MAWESKTKIFGMPLVTVGQEAGPGFLTIAQFAKNGGFFTLAQFGYGVVFIGQFGFGFLSISQFGFGFINITTLGFGIINIALTGIGLLLSYGGGALGFIAIGDSAVGYYFVEKTTDLFGSISLVVDKIIANPYPFFYWMFFLYIIIHYLAIKLGKRIFFKVGDSIGNS